MNEQQIKRIHTVFPCFADVPHTDWQLAETVTVDPFTPHSIREGHILEHAMFILSGWIRVYKLSAAGREITLYRVRSGQSCVLMMASILGETEYEASVSIEAETGVLLLPVPLFRTWLNTYTPVRQFFYKQFIDRMTSVTSLLENIAFQSVPYRVAEYLLAASSASIPSLRITHEQLAIELGTAREVITRILNEFAGKGAITLNRGKITIMNRGKLIDILDQV
ncbi:Crp/Fnr family transcriptional regulator [Paenibacillus sedimenti]|uniref:Crp/Fnr family transcriptional regulator n=1 Tax=Paenibacillus sedimenti TaxID=2770274 RepID=A0A926KXM4_9BACL|nr:Crp/Fnr family transcriptional regulator [Paenibacillus sedimenti]MBD0384014.1 Crp/Fnr family transcriptional regulator [Paenibacillus sedimenti]